MPLPLRVPRHPLALWNRPSGTEPQPEEGHPLAFSPLGNRPSVSRDATHRGGPPRCSCRKLPTAAAHQQSPLGAGEAAAALDAEALSVGAAAASLVVWHSALPHGPAPNTQSAPRVSAYLSMLPVDAAPFLGAQRAADAPLSMADAGTLAYHEEQRQLVYGLGGESAAAGTPPRLRRQSAARRAERWRLRLPMLDEDPREEELPVRPPGEGGAGAVAAALTPLGERLVGLVEWEEEEPAEVCARSG